MGSPYLKVYNSLGVYVASCKHAEDAAAIVAAYGEGATIRANHKRVLWLEGKEKDTAGNSYDIVAETVYSRTDYRPA